MRNLIRCLILTGGILLALYVSIWGMFISPIIEACKSFDAGTLTGTMVGFTVLKCAFSGMVGHIIIFVTGLINGIIGE